MEGMSAGERVNLEGEAAVLDSLGILIYYIING
jgi:hypothetical protein